MQKIEETKTKTYVETTYKANDGTIFATEEECRKYELTAECAVTAAFNSLNPHKQECVGEAIDMYFGWEETGYILKPKNETELAVINQLLSFHGVTILPGADKIGRWIIVSENYGDWYWRDFLNFKESICANIDRLIPKDDENTQNA